MCDCDEGVVCRNGVWKSVNTADVCRGDNTIIDVTSFFEHTTEESYEINLCPYILYNREREQTILF